jgi:hypothetical protein
MYQFLHSIQFIIIIIIIIIIILNSQRFRWFPNSKGH